MSFAAIVVVVDGGIEVERTEGHSPAGIARS